MDIKNKFNEMSVLFPILTLYTLVYMGLMIYAFVLKGAFNMPSGMMAIYIALVGAYAADKEIRRWTGKETPPRKGTLFVYLWLIFYLVVFIIHSLKPDYALPNDLTKVVLQVLGIFFGSKASKKIFQARAQKLVEVILEKGGITLTPPSPVKGEGETPANVETPKADSPFTPNHTTGGQATLSPATRPAGRHQGRGRYFLPEKFLYGKILSRNFSYIKLFLTYRFLCDARYQ